MTSNRTRASSSLRRPFLAFARSARACRSFPDGGGVFLAGVVPLLGRCLPALAQPLHPLAFEPADHVAAIEKTPFAGSEFGNDTVCLGPTAAVRPGRIVPTRQIVAGKSRSVTIPTVTPLGGPPWVRPAAPAPAADGTARIGMGNGRTLTSVSVPGPWFTPRD